ncbi:MAG: hypothetical protein II559_03285, partial [Muribaculaceae bacterium]|nr:hypothetical protein [Muribaculaceae bacterium]
YLSPSWYNVGTNAPILMLYLFSFDWQKSFVFAHRSCQKLKMAKIRLLNNLNELLNLILL